jgi:hypothetical protein
MTVRYAHSHPIEPQTSERDILTVEHRDGRAIA